MVDIASLAIQIDTSDVARAEKDLNRLGSRGATAEKSAKKLGDAYKQASGDVAKVGDASKKSATGLDQLEGRGNAAERSAKKVGAAYGSASSQIEKVGKESKKSASSVNDLANSSDRMAGVARSLGPAVAGMITLESLRRAQQLSEEYTRLQARVERISTSASAAAIAYSQLNDIARRSGSDLGETVRLWEALDRSLGDLGANDAQILRLTDTLQKIGTVGGSSAEEMNNALRQLGQGLASGVIRAEEFNSVLEGMPELAMQIAKGLGVPFKDLRQLMLDGQLTAEDVLTSLQNRAFDVDREFAKLPRTVAQAGSALRNDLGGALSELDKTIGASSNLANLIDALSKGIRFTAGDFTDQERLNQLVKERADLEKSYEQAKRRTILSSREQATYEEGLKRINGEIVEIQDRRIAQLTDEGKQLQSNKAATNEGLVGLREQAKLAGMSAIEREKYVAVQKLGANATAEERAEAEKLAAEAYKLNEARKGSLAGTNQQAQAFQRLMDSLDPAAAAQRQYNDQVKLLKEYLSGDQLAKAVDRLNHAIDGVDATGPGDFIQDYIKQFEKLHDELNPAEVAAREYGEQQDLLNDIIARGGENAEKARGDLAKLKDQYEENTRETTQWAQLTEDAFERVNEAGADMWYDFFQDGKMTLDDLSNVVKRWAAEMANSLTFKPLLTSLGNVIMGTNNQGGIGQVWGSLLGGSGGSGGSSGGMNWGQMLNYGQSAYSAITGVGPAALAGYQSGGVLGGIQGAAGYYGNMLSGAASTVGGLLGYSGAAASAAAGSTAAGYTGSAYASWAAAQAAGGAAGAAGAGGAGAGLSGALSSAASMWYLAPLIGMWQSGKLYDQGINSDPGRLKDQSEGWGALGKTYSAVTQVQAWINEKVGDVLGSVVGDKAAAIITGSPITQWVSEKLGSKLFGGAWETKDGGIALGAEGGELDAQQYIYQKKKGGLFSSSKKRTRFSELDAETLGMLQETFDATEAGVADIFKELSLTVEEGSLAGLQLAREQISTKGKTEEEISEAISAWFGTAAEAMNTELNKVFATGLDYDLAGMQAFVGNLLGVNETLRYLDVEMFDASVSGGKLAESLAAAAGGLEALASNSATYYSAFFTEAEKTADQIDSITRAFEGADVTLAGTRAEYRAMVEDIDLTSAAGQEMFATLMALSGQAAQYYSILEQEALAAYQAMQANIATYYDQFVSAGEKADDMLANVTASFEALDLALPSSRDGFRAVVDGLDTSTEAGQRMFDTLMSVAGAADSYYDILESRAAEVQAAAEAAAQAQSAAAEAAARAQAELLANTASAAKSAASGAISALSKAIDAEKSAVTSAYQSQADAIEAAMDRASDAVSDMRGVADTLRSAVNGLRLESEQYSAQSRRNAQSLIGQTLSGGGRLQMTAQLERALDTVSESSEDLFGSFEDYARDYWQTYFAIESLADKADDQLTAEERTVKALEGQLDQAQRYHEAELERLDGMVDGAQAQLDALLGINTGVLSVEAALAVVASSIGALKQLQNANSSITSVTGLGGVKRQVNSEGYLLDENGEYMQLFGEALRVIGNKVIGGAGSSLNIGADGQLSWGAGDYEKWAKEAGIPGFASGGLHSGGLRLVGENGPELEVTGPSRIYNASQTAAMLGGGGDAAAEVRALRNDFAGMTNALRSVAKHTMQTAKRVEFLERWDFDGLPKERATA